MSEMVERVAKAQAGQRWETFDEEHRNAARDLARDAIRAMREPTDKMICAALDDWDRRKGNQTDRYVWQAMIDEALK